jgi:hypothetical protein
MKKVRKYFIASLCVLFVSVAWGQVETYGWVKRDPTYLTLITDTLDQRYIFTTWIDKVIVQNKSTTTLSGKLSTQKNSNATSLIRPTLELIVSFSSESVRIGIGMDTIVLRRSGTLSIPDVWTYSVQTGYDADGTIAYSIERFGNGFVNAQLAIRGGRTLTGPSSVRGKYIDTFTCNILNPITTGIIDIDLEVIVLWPNPCTTELNYKIPEGFGDVKIVNLLGQSIAFGNGSTVDLSKTLPGVYFFVATNLKGNVVIKKFAKL